MLNPDSMVHSKKQKNKIHEVLIRIGERIKTRRIKKGMTQFDLAEAAGSNQDHISKVEAGKINMTIEYLNKIAEVLNVNTNYFFK
jgi:transcriptional regulator with XRE-family HTH domain